jgi:hypothetical protein
VACRPGIWIARAGSTIRDMSEDLLIETRD